AGLLPPGVRAAYGLDWGPRRERALGATAAVARRVLPLIPGPLRQFPEARRAARRASRNHSSNPGARLGRPRSR
ncbi:MAG: oxygenase MpaB family protein, partial [Solirubrobacteraceae bacterium]